MQSAIEPSSRKTLPVVLLADFGILANHQALPSSMPRSESICQVKQARQAS